MKHTVLTFITKVEPSRVAELDALLKEIAADLRGNPHLPFPVSKFLHFASLVLHEDDTYGPYLIFEHNFDGPLDEYLPDLYQHAAAGLHRIYSCCRDYPAQSADGRAQMLAYLRAHVVRPNAYHVGNVGRSYERIEQENGLRDDIEQFLDGVVRQGPADTPPDTLRQKVQAFVRGQPAYAWAVSAPPRQTPAEYYLPRLKVALAAIVALLLLPILIPLGVVCLIVLRWKEKRDPVPSDLGDMTHVQELVAREDRTHIVQNHMASITVVKPGAFRRKTLKGVLWLVNLIARTINDGKLSGIPSIHFAHWALIDDDRRLLFVSNFDGSWENYLDDFIDKASTGLTAIWSNTVDFPKASFLVREGARDPQHLLPDAPPPAGTANSAPAMRDLGRNGSYLVFRQLAQHVADFYHYLDEATRRLDGQLDKAASSRLAAKFVGRWPNGAPLTLSPASDDPTLSDADDFGYYDTDARGFACPIGSHIRRANPRDSLGPDPPTALASANRHRILRRGRSYGHRPVDPRVEDGIARLALHLSQQRHRTPVRICPADVDQQPGLRRLKRRGRSADRALGQGRCHHDDTGRSAPHAGP